MNRRTRRAYQRGEITRAILLECSHRYRRCYRVREAHRLAAWLRIKPNPYLIPPAKPTRRESIPKID